MKTIAAIFLFSIIGYYVSNENMVNKHVYQNTYSDSFFYPAIDTTRWWLVSVEAKSSDKGSALKVTMDFTKGPVFFLQFVNDTVVNYPDLITGQIKAGRYKREMHNLIVYYSETNNKRIDTFIVKTQLKDSLVLHKKDYEGQTIYKYTSKDPTVAIQMFKQNRGAINADLFKNSTKWQQKRVDFMVNFMSDDNKRWSSSKTWDTSSYRNNYLYLRHDNIVLETTSTKYRKDTFLHKKSGDSIFFNNFRNSDTMIIKKHTKDSLILSGLPRTEKDSLTLPTPSIRGKKTETKIIRYIYAGKGF